MLSQGAQLGSAESCSAGQDSVHQSITGLGTSLLLHMGSKLKISAGLSLLTFLKHLNNFFFSSVKINHFKLYVNLINKDRLQNATRNDFFFKVFQLLRTKNVTILDFSFSYINNFFINISL